MGTNAITNAGNVSCSSLNVSGLTSVIPYLNISHALSAATIGSNLTFNTSTGTLDTAQGIQTSSSPSLRA